MFLRFSIIRQNKNRKIFQYLPDKEGRPDSMLYFRISGTNKLIFFVEYYPLSNFLQGGKVLLLPPWRKVSKGWLNKNNNI